MENHASVSWNRYHYYFRSKEKNYLMRRAKLQLHNRDSELRGNIEWPISMRRAKLVSAANTKIKLCSYSITMGSYDILPPCSLTYVFLTKTKHVAWTTDSSIFCSPDPPSLSMHKQTNVYAD